MNVQVIETVFLSLALMFMVVELWWILHTRAPSDVSGEDRWYTAYIIAALSGLCLAVQCALSVWVP